MQGTRRAGGSGATDASYRSHPLRLAHAGHDGIGAYWSEVTADQRDPRVRFGDPVVDGASAAVEWWTPSWRRASRPP
jgi:hypothetical protein